MVFRLLRVSARLVSALAIDIRLTAPITGHQRPLAAHVARDSFVRKFTGNLFDGVAAGTHEANLLAVALRLELAVLANPKPDAATGTVHHVRKLPQHHAAARPAFRAGDDHAKIAPGKFAFLGSFDGEPPRHGLSMSANEPAQALG
jgi:hypothetical protein